MLTRKDPLVEAVAKVMQENQIRRDVERQVNESFGIHSRNALPFRDRAEYDRVLAEKTEEVLNEELKGNQSKIDANHNNKIDGQDFKILKAKKGQMEEDNESAEKKMQKGEESKEAANMEEEKLDEISSKLASKAAEKARNLATMNTDNGKPAVGMAYRQQAYRLELGAEKRRGKEQKAGVSSGKRARMKEEQLAEKAPPGDKYERMVKHIKSKYSKGGLSDKEKSIAYATAWKAKNKESK